MKGLLTMLMAGLFGLNSCAGNDARTEIFETKDGTAVMFKFFGHASLAVKANGKWIYLDPVGQYGDFSKEHKADAIFITHSHYDHLDAKVVKTLTDKQTQIYSDKVSAEKLGDKDITVMHPGKSVMLFGSIKVETVPAYNTTAGHTQFHPKERQDCGYVFNIGGSRIYVSGDTENTPEVKSLKNIDVAFLPVNQPYTMTVAQAVDAVRALHPRIFYPYHYGEGDQKTDLDRLSKDAGQYAEVRIRGME